MDGILWKTIEKGVTIIEMRVNKGGDKNRYGVRSGGGSETVNIVKVKVF